jgi:Arc/MetJ-type ribon-helix-helix transcriptional regulator
MIKLLESEAYAISKLGSFFHIHNDYILLYIISMYGGEYMPLTVNLGTPYEAIIERLIKRGYAGNKTEALRQALVAYEQKIDAEEEARLVKKKVDEMMADIKSGKSRTYTLEEMREILANKRDR